VDVLAITDHDEIRGARIAREYALEHPHLGADVVVGEEISTRSPSPRIRSIRSAAPTAGSGRSPDPRSAARRDRRLVRGQRAHRVISPVTGRTT
jgi:hypothetical protein